MSLTLKVGSLVIRTLSKPIANYIKKNAREHERFRKLCVSFAQGLHRIDMRMRLGLLQDPAAIERQVAREVKEAEAKRAKANAPTVRTEAETKAAEEAAAKDKDRVEKKVKSEHKLPRIRPLSESKAIETGANFISESFLFLVAGGLILFENRRSKKKNEREHDKRDDEIEAIRNDNSTLKAEIEGLKQSLQLLGVKPESPSSEAPTPEAPGTSAEQANKLEQSDVKAATPTATQLADKRETKPTSGVAVPVSTSVKSLLPNWPSR